MSRTELPLDLRYEIADALAKEVAHQTSIHLNNVAVPRALETMNAEQHLVFHENMGNVPATMISAIFHALLGTPTDLHWSLAALMAGLDQNLGLARQLRTGTMAATMDQLAYDPYFAMMCMESTDNAQIVLRTGLMISETTTDPEAVYAFLVKFINDVF